MAKRILKIFLCEHCKNFKVCLAMDEEPWADTERNLKDKVSLILLVENNNWKSNAPEEKLSRVFKMRDYF